jgi:hypothetical protein
MAGGAIYAAFLVLQFIAISGILFVIGVWKAYAHLKAKGRPQGPALWLSFGFCCAAVLLDGATLLAGQSGNEALVDTQRNAVLAFAAVAFLLAVFGRGTGKITLLGVAAILALISRLLVLSFLLQG